MLKPSIDPREVQALAQIQYAACNPTGVPWSARSFPIQQGWLEAARRQLQEQYVAIIAAE